jgi:hypothetical protein
MMVEVSCDDERLRRMYEKVVAKPNEGCLRKGFVKCPECGEEILLVPSLRKMNEAIENHVKIHKEQLKANPILGYQKAIHIRLVLMEQVLQQASNSLQLL